MEGNVFDGIDKALEQHQQSVVKIDGQEYDVKEVSQQEFDAEIHGSDDKAREFYLHGAANAYAANRFGGYINELNHQGRAKLLQELKDANWEKILEQS